MYKKKNLFDIKVYREGQCTMHASPKAICIEMDLIRFGQKKYDTNLRTSYYVSFIMDLLQENKRRKIVPEVLEKKNRSGLSTLLIM